MFQAVKYDENYLFLICRGTSDSLDEWFFKLMNVQDLIKHCALTTPILLYSLYLNEKGEVIVPNSTKMASKKLIEKMWEDFLQWKE